MYLACRQIGRDCQDANFVADFHISANCRCPRGLKPFYASFFRGPEGPLFHSAALPQGCSSTSQLAPHVFEIVETLFAGEPFGGEDCAFGETAAGFGVVTEVDSVARGFEHDFMQADDVAFAEGGDLEIFIFVSRWLRGSLAGCAIAVPEGASFLWTWWRSKIWPE